MGSSSAGVAWRAGRRKTRLPLLGRDAAASRRRRTFNGEGALRSARGFVGSTPLRRGIAGVTTLDRLGAYGRWPRAAGTVAQFQSAASPHELPLPDEGRTVRAHDAEMRV
jgi:hypothetical protein